MIDLEESYYSIEDIQTVVDCDHDEGKCYSFSHNQKIWEITVYDNGADPRLSILQGDEA